MSKIDQFNNSGVSHSYDFFTNVDVGGFQLQNNRSHHSNNRYELKLGISKSDLSASYVVSHNKNSRIKKEDEFYKTEFPTAKLFGGEDYPMIDPNIKPNMNTLNFLV